VTRKEILSIFLYKSNRKGETIMIQQPPIDKLIKTTGNKYVLANGVAKRARQIIEQPHTATQASEKFKPISAAAQEVYEERVKFVND
jgi:DNA-directed RNA polymerase omega subunit